MGAASGLTGVTLVNARGTDDREPAQHVPRGGAEGGHREAAHDARLRAREPAFLALEAELAVVLVGDAHGDVICKPQEPVVELTEVPKHERAHATEGVEVVPLPTADAVGLVVVTAGAAAARQDPVRALRARSAIDVMELPAVLRGTSVYEKRASRP